MDGREDLIAFHESRIAYIGSFDEDRDETHVYMSGFTLSENPNRVDISIFPPYNTAFDHINQRKISGIDVYFPYDIARTPLFLKKLLRSGQVKSYVTESQGAIHEALPNFWLSHQCEDVLKYDVSTLVLCDKGMIFGRVSINIEDINNFFVPSEIEKIKKIANQPKITILTNKKPPGRPPKYSTSHFFAEAQAVIYEDGYPERFQDFVDAVLDRYERAGHPNGRPSDDWAEEQLRPTWNSRPGGTGLGGK